MNKNLLTIDDICHELGIGRTTAYKLLKKKPLNVISKSKLPKHKNLYIYQHTPLKKDI